MERAEDGFRINHIFLCLLGSKTGQPPCWRDLDLDVVFETQIPIQPNPQPGLDFTGWDDYLVMQGD